MFVELKGRGNSELFVDLESVVAISYDPIYVNGVQSDKMGFVQLGHVGGGKMVAEMDRESYLNLKKKLISIHD